jgi:hypothetical protein
MSAPVREPDDDGPSKDGPLNYAPRRARRPERDRDTNSAPRQSGPVDTPRGSDAVDAPRKVDAVPQGAAELPEPPWKRKKQRQAFAGDVAAAELRTRLALAPDRLPDPPPPVSTVPKFGSAARLAGVIMVATAGVVGYRWGAAPKATTAPTPFELISNQADLASEWSVSVASLDSKPLAVRSAASDPAPGPVVGDARGVTNGATSVSAAPAASLSPIPAPPVSALPAASKVIAPNFDERKSRDPTSDLTDNTVVDRKGLQLEWLGKSAVAPAKSQPRRIEAAEIALMVKNGTEFMANGNIGAARMMFQPAAEAGNPAAAFALAETYDPLVLSKLGTKGGITPDVALAHNWYEKAKELGSTVAPERLERLARLPE